MEFLRPHRTIPNVPWSAQSRWDFSWRRMAILVIGLSFFGIGEAFLVQSMLGNSPWTVLAQGVSIKTSLPLGIVTGMISVVVLLLWIPLKEKPGLGTISNIIVIPISLQITITLLPETDSKFLGLVFAFLGVATIGMGSALYISCHLGPGPRDGLMTALHHRTGIRVGRVRFFLEAVVFLIGWALGGRVGIGTALFALLIGQSIAISFGVVSRITAK
jgi:uncharacterized membrane protein YczE